MKLAALGAPSHLTAADQACTPRRFFFFFSAVDEEEEEEDESAALISAGVRQDPENHAPHRDKIETSPRWPSPPTSSEALKLEPDRPPNQGYPADAK